MKKYSAAALTLIATLAILLFSSISAFSQECVGQQISEVVDVQRYNRAIHIMAMLILGFGFLMVFVKKYGRSALTATFLLVSVSIPMYFFIADSEVLSESRSEIEMLILAEFGAASLLIAAGALLGRIKMYQYIILALLFIPGYMLNEWIVLENGAGIMPDAIADTGGSIVIHAFGALFGLSAALSLTSKKDLETPVHVDANSDRFSMLGSMVLWVFWPSFCAALVPVEAIPYTIINVFLALSGSTVITYILSTLIRGKINIADVANAALAGGVAIGATCDHASHGAALLIGVLAGAISTVGFAIIKDRQQKVLKAIDTCGVTNLHGLPGLFGGLAAIPLVEGLSATSQLLGIAITIGVAIIGGLITGKIVSLFGKRQVAYVDAEEFEDAEYE
ncbi:MAG: ammonium transporter [Bacteroidetes bacterium]|nr:ammonium transporter [Bacteroidota bacterium]